MARKVRLSEICFVRSGDKGDISNIGLMATNDENYEIIKKKVTPERIKEHFKDWVKGRVDIYEMPNVNALEIVMFEALGGGATKTLRIDQTGKEKTVCVSGNLCWSAKGIRSRWIFGSIPIYRQTFCGDSGARHSLLAEP